MGKIKLGISLYCFTKEYATGEFTFEDCVKTAKELGAAGYEIVASQMIPSYPNVDVEFLEQVKQCTDKYGISPICYGANMDCGMIKGRDLSIDEMVERCIIDIKSAAKLGCKIIRQQYLLSPEGLRRIEPYARLYGVKVGIEMHNPETPSSANMLEYINVIKETKSSYIGLIPDFGCFAIKPNKPHWDAAIEAGAEEKHLNMAAQMKYDGVPLKEAIEELRKVNANEAVFGALQGMYGFVTFYNHPDLEGLKRIMPYCIHFHGKFHYLDKENKEVSIPYEDLLPLIQNSDFEGYIMSEYEDHVSGNAVEMTKKHIQLENNILNSSTQPI